MIIVKTIRIVIVDITIIVTIVISIIITILLLSIVIIIIIMINMYIYIYMRVCITKSNRVFFKHVLLCKMTFEQWRSWGDHDAFAATGATGVRHDALPCFGTGCHDATRLASGSMG